MIDREIDKMYTLCQRIIPAKRKYAVSGCQEAYSLIGMG